MKEMFIMIGISGSGKSHYAKELAAQKGREARIFSADQYFTNSSGVYKMVPDMLPDAHNWCFREAVNYATSNKNGVIIVDNTNLTLVEIAPYYRLAAAFATSGYKFICIDTNADLAWSRQIHGVPMEIFNKQVDRLRYLRENSPRWLTERIEIVNGGEEP